jgi:hypothetical protein
MLTTLTVLVSVSFVITLGILIAGLITMARGSERSNLLMRFRVLFQFITIVLVIVLILVKTNS